MNLNNKERKEIKEDVKDALGKAKSSIDITKEKVSSFLNQKEIDNMIKRQNRKPVAITIIITIIIMASFLYLYFSNNPKIIFTRITDDVFYNLKIMLPQNNVMEGSFTLKSNLEEKMDINIIYAFDKKNNLMKANVTSDNNPYMKIYHEERRTFVYIEALDKYVLVNNKGANIDLKKILDSLNKAITKVINEEKLTCSTVREKINNKEEKVYKTSFIINKDNKSRIINTLYKSLTEDKELMGELKKINDKSSSNIKQDINMYLKENIKENTYNIYTKNGEFVKFTNNSVSITKIDENTYEYLKNGLTGKIKIKNSKNNLNIKVQRNDTNRKMEISSVLNKAKKFSKEQIDYVKYEDLTVEDKLEMTLNFPFLDYNKLLN